MTIGGIEYSFATAPRFIQYSVKLIIELWGTNTGLAPKFVQHQARLLAEKWGVPA